MNEKKEKKPKRFDKPRKPINHLDFDALDLAIVNKKLVATDKMLVLNRNWRTTTDDRMCLCTVLRIDENFVTLNDETLGQEFAFDIVKDASIYPLLRIYDKTKIRKISKAEAQQALQQKCEEAILEQFSSDESVQIGELLERLSNDHTTAEIRTALLSLTDKGTVVLDDEGGASLRDNVVGT